MANKARSFFFVCVSVCACVCVCSRAWTFWVEVKALLCLFASFWSHLRVNSCGTVSHCKPLEAVWYMHTHTHTWIHPEGRGWNEIRWNESWHVATICYHVCNMTLSPILENAWHDMINGKPVLGLAGSHSESRYRFMRPWTLPPHLPSLRWAT